MCFLFFVTSCVRKFDYVDEVHRVTGLKIRQLCKEENLSVAGSGGAMMDEITKIKFTLDARRRVDIKEARRLCVRCIEELKDAVNATESLKPYLSPYPFPASGVRVGIMFSKKSGGYVDYGCAYLGTGGVSAVFQLNNMLYYSSFNPRTQLLEDYYEEPYEEALRLVQQSQCE